MPRSSCAEGRCRSPRTGGPRSGDLILLIFPATAFSWSGAEENNWGTDSNWALLGPPSTDESDPPGASQAAAGGVEDGGSC
jgi:hypothetical protein